MTEMETFDLEWVQYVVASNNPGLNKFTVDTSKLVGDGIYKFKIRDSDKYILASRVYNTHGLLVWQLLKVKTSISGNEIPIERSYDAVYYSVDDSDPFLQLGYEVRWSPMLYMNNNRNVTPKLPVFFQGLSQNFFGYHDKSNYVEGARFAYLEFRPCVPDYHATRLGSIQGRMMMDSEFRDIWVRSYSAPKHFHGSRLNLSEDNNWYPHFMRRFTVVKYGYNEINARVISMVKSTEEPVGAKGRWMANAKLPAMEQGKTYPGYPSSSHFIWSRLRDRLAVYVDGDVFYYGGASSPLRGLSAITHKFRTNDEIGELSVLLGTAGSFVPFMPAHPLGFKAEGFYYDFISWFTSDYTGELNDTLLSGVFDTADTLPGIEIPRTDEDSIRRNNFLKTLRDTFTDLWGADSVRSFDYRLPSGRTIPVLMPQTKLFSVSPVPNEGMWVDDLKQQGMLALIKTGLPMESSIAYPTSLIRDSTMILPTMRLVSKSRDSVDGNTARMTAGRIESKSLKEHPLMKLLPDMDRLVLEDDFVTGHPHDIFRVGESVSDGYMNIALPIYLMNRHGLSSISPASRPGNFKQVTFSTGARGIYTHEIELYTVPNIPTMDSGTLKEKIRRAPLRDNRYDLSGQVGGLLMDITANSSDIVVDYRQDDRSYSTADLYTRYIHSDSGRRYLGAMFTVTGSDNYIEIDLGTSDARAIVHGSVMPTAELFYEIALVSFSGSNNVVNIVFRKYSTLSVMLKSIAGGMRTHLLDNRTGNNNQVWLTHADGKDVATRMRFGQNRRVDALPTLFGRI